MEFGRVFAAFGFSLAAFLAVTVVIPPDVSADNSGLFSGSAREKAEQRHRRTVNNRRARLFSDDSTVQDFAELDTVDEILEEGEGRDFFAQYRGPFYMSYVYDVVPIRELDDWQTKSMAERVLVYQAASELSKVLVKSALEPLYREAVEAVRVFRDYTSLKVGQRENGNLGVAESSEDEKPLLEFKLHVSANYGVEPRIKIGENCTLRHDVINQETLLEFRRDF